jgi:hypothetical protein
MDSEKLYGFGRTDVDSHAEAKRLYRFVWSRNFGEKLAIPKGATVEALAFGKLRSALVRWNGKLYLTDRYALRKI